MIPAPERPLVSPEWVRSHLTDSTLRLVDCRWYLTGSKSGRLEYENGHLPGAVFVDVHTELAERPGPGRHPLPRPETFARLMSRIGVGPETFVVAYDDAGGANAARLWWLLDYFGHAGAAVLDGGLPRWVADGLPLETAVPSYPPANFVAQPQPGRVVDRVGVTDRAADAVLIDARAAERYRGDFEPFDPRAGHIPGAVSVPFADNLEQGVFRPPDALKERFVEVGADRSPQVIVYCGSGVTACHDLLALRIAGISGALLYEGSWSDWCSDPDAPIGTGSGSS